MIKKLGDSIYQFTYPSPIKVIPPVNGYLILADKPVLIDGGTSDDATFNSFREDLGTLGLKFSDLGEVLVTHNHVDHIGLPARIAALDPERRIHVHQDEWFMVCASDEERLGFRDTLMETIAFWGVPKELIVGMKDKIVGALRFGGGIRRDQVVPYPQQETFKVAGLELEAIHCPGHTDGLVCLWWPSEKGIFSNDHVLPNITPNPTIYMQPRNGRRCGLADYLHSLSFVEHLPAKQVYPGHGVPFTGLKERVRDIRTDATDRKQKIIDALRESGSGNPTTIIELTTRIWSELSPMDTFLAAREVHGHMEMFLEENLVELDVQDGVGIYRLSSRHARVAPFENVGNV
jgi:glyoxylase-like metal-dependent hydrolase (beta-lactamase superfamily II)